MPLGLGFERVVGLNGFRVLGWFQSFSDVVLMVGGVVSLVGDVLVIASSLNGLWVMGLNEL